MSKDNITPENMAAAVDIAFKQCRNEGGIELIAQALQTKDNATAAAETRAWNEALEKTDDKLCELYQREKEIGIRDRDSTALDMLSFVRALKKQETI